MANFTVDLNLFNSSIGTRIEKINNDFVGIFYKSAGELLDKIKEYTPVGNPNLWKPPYWPKGYVPGTLRASWEMALENGSITIKNEQPYAYQVEYGWSKQAPKGMLRRALLEFDFISKYRALK